MSKNCGNLVLLNVRLLTIFQVAESRTNTTQSRLLAGLLTYSFADRLRSWLGWMNRCDCKRPGCKTWVSRSTIYRHQIWTILQEDQEEQRAALRDQDIELHQPASVPTVLCTHTQPFRPPWRTRTPIFIITKNVNNICILQKMLTIFILDKKTLTIC